MRNTLAQAEFEDFFRKFSKTIYVFPKPVKSKGENYDPFRNIGLIDTRQNPLPVQALFRTITADSLIYRDLGLVHAGAIEILIKDNDVTLIKVSDKCKLNNIEYYAYSKAVANKLQIFPSQYSGYSRVVLFRSNT